MDLMPMFLVAFDVESGSRCRFIPFYTRANASLHDLIGFVYESVE